MKHTITTIVLAVFFITSFAFAQVDKTGTVTEDATQSRLRLGHFVLGGPNVDFYVNGQIAVNGGQEQINIPFGYVNGYLFLTPGTYSVAVVLTGESMEEALIDSLELSLLTGHRYSLLMIGQLEDSSIKPLLIDETEAEAQLGASPNDSVLITVNNLLGANTIDTTWDGQPLGKSVPYGGFEASVQSAGTHPFKVTATGTRTGRLVDNYAGFNVPGKTSLQVYAGQWPYPGLWEKITTPGVSRLNVVEYLQGYSQQNLKLEGRTLSFDIFLAALETSGLSEELGTGGPYVVFAPIDEAFEALSKDELDALMADPEALGEVVRNHISEEFVPRGGMAKTPGGKSDRSLTNLLGRTLLVGDDFNINGTFVGGLVSAYIANGSQVHLISKVLLPPSQ